MRRNQKKKEFSKVITGITLAIWIVVTIYSLVMMVVVMDLAPLAWVFGSVDAAAAIVVRFYFKKAERENEIKLRQIYGDLARETEKNAAGYEDGQYC